MTRQDRRFLSLGKTVFWGWYGRQRNNTSAHIYMRSRSLDGLQKTTLPVLATIPSFALSS